MAQLIQHDRYPKFVADQVLTEKSLNQMFGYLEEQQRLTRTTLIGIGILCGMEVSVNAARTALTIAEGVGVTSKGYLVPFPETTYTFYDDEFSAEQEFLYPPFIDPVTQQQKFPLYLMHSNGAAEIKKPITAAFLEDKAVVIFVELLKVDNKNCDPDSCDDKGITVEVTHRPLLVELEDLDELIFGDNEQGPFLNEPACIEWPEIRMPRYNVPATFLLSSQAVLKNFLVVLTSDFILNIENTLSAAYSSFGYYIRDEFPNNPFSGLKNSFSFLYNGNIGIEQLLFVQYYYDFFSDLILAYEELRKMCNECLTLCCPNEALFPRHLILGNAIPATDEFRHHWIASPAFACDCCSEGRIKFLLKKIVLLINKLDLPRNIFANDNRKFNIRITPSRYGDIPLSDKAIPYYYNVVNPPNELYNNWNFQKTKLRKGDTNLSYDAPKYNSNPYIKDPLSYDIEPYSFLRIEGHLGQNWKNALAEINKIKYEKRLPIDVVALNGDIFELIRSLLTDANSLADILAGNKDIAGELWCYFADIESQYDAHAAELRCTLLKVMAYFYNLPIVGNPNGPVATTNIPQSDMVRNAFPNYRTFANTYGADFDQFYAPLKNQPYITPQAFLKGAFAGAANNLLSPIYLMYYLEKIDEVLVDGLVQLKINDLKQRLGDASLVATAMLLALDNLPEFELPAMWEESLDAIIRICKAEVFNVLYRNFLINYVLFIANQSFAWYAFKNPGVQHKAGVTTGGTFILVYNDKQEIRQITRVITGTVRAVTGAPLPGVNVLEKGTTNGAITNFTGSYSITVTNPNATLVAFLVGMVTKEVSTTGLNKVDIILTNLSATAEFAAEAEPAAGNPLEGIRATRASRAAGNPIMDLRFSEASIKATGLKDIFDLVAGQGSDEGLSDEALTELVSQFPDGTVIADFFVPNMCKAACMPMNFIVMGDSETPPGETDIRLDIKPREFCEDDKNNYDIRVAPEGGILKVDGTVINNPIFNPGTVAVGNEPMKEVVITYEINGDVKNLRVRVYKKPVVVISIATIDHVNHVVEFKNETTFADRYAWNFGNGQFSDKQDPGPIGFGNARTAVITLKAFNGPCEIESQPITVVFEDQSRDRTCTPIDELGEKFKILNEISSAEFKRALEDYPLLQLIFIEKFGNIVGLPQEEQCKLLLSEIKVSTIQRIIRVLNAMVISNKELRRSALLLYEVLLKLVLFYSCCQEGDVNDAGTNMETTLKIMVGQIVSWQEQIEFTDEEKSILESMLKAVQRELDETTEGTPEKTVYIDFLKMLVEALSKLL